LHIEGYFRRVSDRGAISATSIRYALPIGKRHHVGRFCLRVVVLLVTARATADVFVGDGAGCVIGVLFGSLQRTRAGSGRRSRR